MKMKEMIRRKSKKKWEEKEHMKKYKNKIKLPKRKQKIFRVENKE